MPEANDILALVARFTASLTPLDCDVLRQRDHGRVYRPTREVAARRRVSRETVRTIENRALEALADCVALAEAGRKITAVRLAKSFRQPVASLLCRGL